MSENRPYNLILTCLSSLAPAAKKAILKGNEPDAFKYFLSGKNEPIAEGVMTNEAAIKYTMKLLKKNNKAVDAIYYIATKKVSEINESGITDIDYFKDRIKKFCKEENIAMPIYWHPDNPVSDEPSGRELVNLSVEIAEKIREIKEKNSIKRINLYIDANGGFRELVSIVTAVLRTMDSDKIHIEKVIGVNVDSGKKVGKYVDKTEAYQIYDLYSGIDEFINYGRSRMIEQYFKETQKENMNEKVLTSEMRNVISAITEMSNAFVLCRPKLILEKTLNLKQSIYRYENSNNKTKIFTYITKKINGVYGAIFKSFEDGDIYNFNTIKEILNYCIDKYLIQQALTIYSECMPDILYQSKIIYPGNKTKKAYDQYYNYLNERSKNGYQYSKGYTFIQQYLGISHTLSGIHPKDKNKLISSTGIRGQYEEFIGQGNYRYTSIKDMLTYNFLYSNYDFDKVEKIYNTYKSIKTLRNLSNHADREQKDAKKQSIVQIKKELKKAINEVDELIGG